MQKRKLSDNISIAEIFLLVILLLCYGGTIFFFILNLRTYFLVFFLLYSCISVVFLLVSHDRMTRFSLQQTDQTSLHPEDEFEMISQYTRELSTLKQEQEHWLEEKTQLQSDYSSLEKKNAELSSSLEQLQGQISDSQSENLNDLLPPEETPVELNILSTVKAVIEEMTPYSRRAGIQLLLSSANDTLMVRADASYIRILFKNIIDNSIKYMHRNGNLVITVSNIGDDLFIVLKDNGEGLPSTETAHIFELNYQVSNRVSGNGLGLTQAKAIVEYYGGTIHLCQNLSNRKKLQKQKQKVHPQKLRMRLKSNTPILPFTNQKDFLSVRMPPWKQTSSVL